MKPSTIKKINLINDQDIAIATGRNRKDINWKSKQVQWSEFLSRVSDTHRTAETYAEYISSPKSRQDEIKDVGGFVGGLLSGGRRKNEAVVNRQLLTLDIDFGTMDIWEKYKESFGYAACIYSTHKHSPVNNRLRLVIPLSTPVFRDQYEPICRKVAEKLGINDFDDTTFEACRLMYFPSTSKDGEYIFDYVDAEFMNPDYILNMYQDWRDTSQWAQSERVSTIIKREIKKQGDPLEKPGLIGAFCRAYTVPEAIELFLTEEYEHCNGDRYTYLHGSTSGGLIVYEDKFGLRDEDAKDGTAHNRLPSFTAMTDFCKKDAKVINLVAAERLSEAQYTFSGIDIDEIEAESDSQDASWYEKLQISSKGKILSTIDNVVVILENDPMLKNRIGLNEFAHRATLLKSLPWRKYQVTRKYLENGDDAALRHYLEKCYEVSGMQKVRDGLTVAINNNSFHPIKDYLKTCIWDGVPRLDTYFIDYLGAKDTELNRAVTRKSFVAAVKRIYEPGCKYDYVLVLVGPQGCYKSSSLKKIGGVWYSDSLTTIKGKEAYEQLQGAWIIELGELAGFSKAESSQIKHFITKQEDRFRVAYGERVEDFPRQCVFFGTTNKRNFLRDSTGDRRFWTVDVREQEPKKNLFEDLNTYEVDQIWAEALHYYRLGEEVFLSPELEQLMFEEQTAHSVVNDKIGLVEEYLNTPVPLNWYELDIHDRRAFIRGDEDFTNKYGSERMVRDKICVAEIWCELFGGNTSELGGWKTKEYHDIMRNLDGWEEHKGGSKGRLKISKYGLQKVYLRNHKSANKD